MIILTELGNGSLSGYDAISFIHNKFHLLVSSGKVYSLLCSLERNGVVEGTWNERKRVCKLTEKGKNNRNNTKHKRQNQKLHNSPPKSPIYSLNLFCKLNESKKLKNTFTNSLRTK